MNSALYIGRVTHTRLRPRHHHLSYACYWLLLDLDELGALDRRLRLFSFERFNLFSFRNADHGDGSAIELRAQIEGHLREAGIDIGTGKILLLTMPRVVGHGFNPLSIYFCYRQGGDLAALVYEVHNTFRQRHSYLIATNRVVPPSATVVEQHCDKRFYVSPFLQMDLHYDFSVSGPDDAVRVVVRASDRDGPLLNASLVGERRTLDDVALATTFLSHPLLTLKVIGAIHYEALKLWWKGVRLVPRPPPPTRPVTTKIETLERID